MTREAISLTIADLSAFTRALKRETGSEDSHQTWLNHVSRAAGFRNHQHLVARLKGAEPEPPANDKQVARALRYFGADGRMTIWPAKTGVQKLCLWVIWSRLPKDTVWSEREVSAVIDTQTEYRDAAIIRRTLVEMGLLARERDGSNYTRLERRPGPEERALIRAVAEKAKR